MKSPTNPSDVNTTEPYYLDYLNSVFAENIQLHQKTYELLGSKILNAIREIETRLKKDGTLFWAGNGGSAADAQHMAAELIGRYKKERKPIRSLALTTNTSTLTAIANDYSYDSVLCRELEAFAKKGDVLIAISTSGNSKNILEVSKLARSLGVFVIALTGETGGKLAEVADLLLNIPSRDTPRIQEVHLLIEHAICEEIEKRCSASF